MIREDKAQISLGCRRDSMMEERRENKEDDLEMRHVLRRCFAEMVQARVTLHSGEEKRLDSTLSRPSRVHVCIHYR
jgi:predicted Fe-S protein YdhL (DUF1289 family)